MSPTSGPRAVSPGVAWLNDMLILSACWVAAYGLRFWLASPRRGHIAFGDYLLTLPVVLAVYTGALIVGGAYRPLARAGLPAALRLTALPAAAAAVIIYATLRSVCPAGVSHSRTVVGNFVLLAAVALAASRLLIRTSVPFPGMRSLDVPSSRPIAPGFAWLLDVSLLSLGWGTAYALRFFVLAPCAPGRPPFEEYVMALPAVLALYSLVFAAAGAYRSRSDPAVGDVHRTRPGRDIAFAQLWPATAAAAGLSLLLWTGLVAVGSRGVILAFAVLAAGAAVARQALFHGTGPAGYETRVSPSAAARRYSAFAAKPTALGTLGPIAIVVAASLWWYGWYLSFPLFGEDGAANYSTLVETARATIAAPFSFPIKWLEGLGQPNVFVTAAFDPFSWVMFTGLADADAFRLSYALRATVGWLAAYVFATVLFRGARALAASVATLTVIIAFVLSHPWGIPTFAGMFTATQMALFPALLALYVDRARDPRLIAWRDALFLVTLVIVVLVYPIASVLPLIVTTAFGAALVWTAPSSARRGAALALARFLSIVTGLLFAPVFGVFHAWSAVAGVSARTVFAGELTTYGRDLLLPHLWHDVPLGVRAVVVLAILAISVRHRWPHPLRAVVLALTAVVAVSQAAGLVRSLDVWPWLFARLPRPFYLEFYLPVFYAAPAAYVLHRWTERRLRPVGVSAVAAVIAVILGAAGVLGTIAAFLRWRAQPRVREVRHRALVPAVVVAAVAGSALWTWQLSPQTMHPLFGRYVHCRTHGIWCADPPGASVGAGASPITEFLRDRLVDADHFAGRAEFLLRPPLRLATFPRVDEDPSPDTAAAVMRWYEQARRQAGGNGDARGVAPVTAAAALRQLVWHNELPEDVILDIREWAASHPEHVRDVRLAPGWGHDAEINVAVQERNRNFAATGNGMLLRALPLQGVPVASSYEQSLDQLYYLLWTRYVNAGTPLRHSINLTTLSRLWPERLALIGVKYVVARDIPLSPLLALPAVFRWNGYSIYEIEAPNTVGWSVRTIVGAPTLTDELRAMRDTAFDPRHTAVVSAQDLGILGTPPWAPLAASSVTLRGQSLRFTARSAGRRTLAVLPFKFSRCWRPEWRSGPGQIVRVDVGLLAVAFEEATDVQLTWSAGYGHRAECLRRDADLMPQVKTAAAEVE